LTLSTDCRFLSENAKSIFRGGCATFKTKDARSLSGGITASAEYLDTSCLILAFLVFVAEGTERVEASAGAGCGQACGRDSVCRPVVALT